MGCRKPPHGLRSMCPCSREEKVLPEQTPSSICSSIGLHPLETAHAVMQNLGRWMNCQRCKRNNARGSPTRLIHVLHQEHVVCEVLTKRQFLQRRTYHCKRC